jgi:VWFA-related protein
MNTLKAYALVIVMLLGSSGFLAETKSTLSHSLTQDASQKQRVIPPGTIRVRVRLVPVDVTVTDKDGKPVPDLRQEDFQIFEDGKEQEIRHFSVQNMAEAAPDVSMPTARRQIPTLELAPQNSRTFLILMGRGRFQTPFRIVDALVKFVRNDLQPQDRVAVYAYNRATDFTTDHEAIAQVLERYGKRNEKIESWVESQMTGLAVIYGIGKMGKSVQSEIDGIFENAEGLGYRQPPPVPPAKQDRIRSDARKVLAETSRAEDASKVSPFDKLEADLITDLSFDEFAKELGSAMNVMQDLVDCIQYMRYMEGEKHLLFFSREGIFTPSGNTKYEEQLAKIANDARVTIDCFQTAGVPFNRSWSQVFAIQTIRNISALTGGHVGIYEDVGKALDRVNEATRIEYLLGYYPADNNWTGLYRRISVKVKRPGVQVNYRHGYVAADTIQPYDREEFLAYSRISSAAAYEGVLSDVTFKVITAAVTDAAGSPQIKVDVQIDPKTIKFKSSNGRHIARLRIAVFYGRYRQSFGEDWKTMDLNLQEETFGRFMQSSIPFSTIIPVKEPRQILKVIVYDCGSDRVGSALIKIQ